VYNSKYKTYKASNHIIPRIFISFNLQLRMSDSNTVYKLLSSEIKALASRISKQDELITLLQGEIVRLSSGTSYSRPSGGAGSRDDFRPPTHRATGAPSIPSTPFRGSIPLSSSSSAPPKTLVKRVRPIIATDGKSASVEGTPLSLADVLKKDEVVTVEVGLTRYEDGTFSNYATCVANFDGADLNVTECDLAKEMIGFKTSKPGEILYKFMDLLAKTKHIKGTFKCPPWKLCSVARDGEKVTLDELRSKLGSR
jgi:hypothetical protein